MAEEEQSPKPAFSTHVTGPGGNPAAPATTNTARPKKKWIIVAGILVLVVIIASALLVLGVVDTTPDPIIGTWAVGSTNLQMQFGADGTAVLRYPDTGYSATGRWEKVAENQYRLSSATGIKSPLLSYDPIADSLQTGDYSLIFSRRR
ncbi:MAG: hypothetical protein LUQ71_07285 [Methanoregula sp.]|nr:hypothetical protein [Methanoregula sp.]